MTNLSTDQLLYLLYAVAYSIEGTVTKGVVREHLPKKFQKDVEHIYEALSKQKLVELTGRSRLSVTEEGRKTLVSNLQTTKYQFDSQRGPKVLNTLLGCLKQTSSKAKTSTTSTEEIDFDTFVEKFKELYFEERKRQELRGVVAIDSREICQKFMEHYPISQAQLDKYFDLLKSSGKVFAVVEKDDELIQWVE